MSEMKNRIVFEDCIYVMLRIINDGDNVLITNELHSQA
jgi:hypothetical protein